MAMVIGIVSPAPEPVSGEKLCLIDLSFTPAHGYRLKAFTSPGNREIGRWVSDCPLTIVTSAFLWLTQYAWNIQDSPSGLSTSAVLDQVPHPAENRADVHPLDIISVLAGNFPPKVPTSPVTGAAVHSVRPPQTMQPAAPTTPSGFVRRALPGPVAPAAPAPSAVPPAAARQTDQQMALFLRDQIRAIQQGASAQDVMAQIEVVRTQNPHLFGTPDEDDLEDAELDEVLAQMEQEAEIPAPPPVTSSSPLPPLPPGVRPLLPGEVPAGLTARQAADLQQYGASDSDREKLLYGSPRQRALQQRVRAHVQAQTQVGVVAPPQASAPAATPNNGGGAPLAPADLAAAHKANIDRAKNILAERKAVIEQQERQLEAELVKLGQQEVAAPAAPVPPVAAPVQPASASPAATVMSPATPVEEETGALVSKEDFVSYLIQFPAFKAKAKSLMRKEWDELHAIVQKTEADSGVEFVPTDDASRPPAAAPAALTDPPVA